MSADEKNLDPNQEPMEGAEASEAGEAEATTAEAGSEVEKLQAEVANQKDQLMRALAEIQNVRRRAEQDVEKAHKFALEKFSRELLPVVDSLEKTVEASRNAEGDQLAALREGTEMTLSLLTSALVKFGLAVVDPLGEPFDPQLHEAMSMVEQPSAEPNSVIAVVQKGYTLNGRLLRPAMVVVAKGGAGSKVDTQA